MNKMRIILTVENGAIISALTNGSIEVFVDYSKDKEPIKGLVKVDPDLISNEELHREIISRGIAR